ncbi:MAG: hypothetical protein V1913_02135 [Fibrobacterota bacterium]
MEAIFKLFFWYLVYPVFKLALFLSPLILPGILIRGVKARIDNLLLNDFGRIPYYFFAAMGTPVHEAGHLLAAKLTGHKILRFSLFSPDKSGRLGYVEHAYNPDSVWQRAGCLFIGLAPVLAGTTLIVLLTRLFFPDLLLHRSLEGIVAQAQAVKNLKEMAPLSLAIGHSVVGQFLDFWQAVKASDWRVLVYLLLVIGIGSHMFPSTSDLKGMAPGAFLLYLAVCVWNAVAWHTSLNLHAKGYGAWAIGYGAGLLLFILMVLTLAGLFLWGLAGVKHMAVHRGRG